MGARQGLLQSFTTVKIDCCKVRVRLADIMGNMTTKGAEMMKSESNLIESLLRERERIIAELNVAKAMVKLQKTKVSNRNMQKYFDLQRAYVESCKGI
jgi:hypothetical protein